MQIIRHLQTPQYVDYGLCTCKWGNSSLVESLEQSHKRDFHVTHFFQKKYMHNAGNRLRFCAVVCIAEQFAFGLLFNIYGFF